MELYKKFDLQITENDRVLVKPRRGDILVYNKNYNRYKRRRCDMFLPVIMKWPSVMV